jgi:hypothetical protein
MLEQDSSDISQAVFDTLLYSDVFDFPLTAPEIHSYLLGRSATVEEVCQALSSDPGFSRVGDYFTLTGREEIVPVREIRELRSQKLLPYALAYGRMIGSLPFIRMVGLTGSLAVRNASDEEDFDYMLVTQPGRLWTARAFVLLFARLTRLAGHTICPNVIVAGNSLEWGQHDLYSARDLCQMIPVAGMDMYLRLMKANLWVRDFLPNIYEELAAAPLAEKQGSIKYIQGILEYPFRGRLGDHFERWEMNRKIERFSRQAGFGEETIFNASICQGNFDHHRRWTHQEIVKRQVASSEGVNGGRMRL